jgi:hypothetical protein
MAAMSLTARQLNRATLERQLLLRRASMDVAEAVRHVVALQAQQPASPYLALWNRLADFDPADLDAAFAERRVVKATLVRLALHAVHADDYPEFHNAMLARLRSCRLGDPRFTTSGLTIAEADALQSPLAGFLTQPRTSAEIEDFIESRFGECKRGAWWALRTFAAVHRAPTGGPWSFGTSSFITAVTKPGPAAQDESAQWLTRRYLQAFGPASAADVARFTFLKQTAVRPALRGLADQIVEQQGPDGTTLYDVVGAHLPAEDVVAPPRLLPMWDSILLAYADRSRVIPPEYLPFVIRRNGDVLPTLLVDGYVAGVWRSVEGGIEATAFHELDGETWVGLAAEAVALVAFLADRDPTAYQRYAHWWAKELPRAEVRLLSERPDPEY